MLDQNTDRMWYVIGAVLIGAAIIMIANGSIPQMFASVTDSFEETSNQTLVGINGGNVLYDGDKPVSNKKYLMKTYDLVHDDIPYGAQMTITMKADLHPDKTGFGFYNSSGHGSDQVVLVKHKDFNNEGIAQKTFAWDYRVGEVSNSYLHMNALFNANDDGGVDNVPNSVDWVHIEYGTGSDVSDIVEWYER